MNDLPAPSAGEALGRRPVLFGVPLKIEELTNEVTCLLYPDLYGKFYLLRRLSYHYTSGWYEKSGAQLFVNRGIGTIGFPIRFGAAPEITVLELART